MYHSEIADDINNRIYLKKNIRWKIGAFTNVNKKHLIGFTINGYYFSSKYTGLEYRYRFI